MQSEFPYPSWPIFNTNIDLSYDQIVIDTNADMGAFDLTCQFPNVDDDFWRNLEGFDPALTEEIENISNMLDGSDGDFPSQQKTTEKDDGWSPCPSMKSSEASMEESSIQRASLVFPGEDMEIDGQVGIPHLLKAYAEAVEKKETELAEVIQRCISGKANPTGETLERLAFSLFQFNDKEGEYLKQESMKNLTTAFKSLYQLFPYGKFAHLAANSVILEAIPDDAMAVHVADFDMGEGVQWSSLIEAIGRQGKALRLISMKWAEETPSPWKFEETKERLYQHARSAGLELKVEEMSVEDLVSEMKKLKKRGGRRDFLACNCMVGIPHMGRLRGRKNITEFLRTAKDLMNHHRGIITFGNGENGDILKNCSSYESFFDGFLRHYQAMYESMAWNFPSQLNEARLAMESLFLAPFVSSLGSYPKWEEMKNDSEFQVRFSEFQGCRHSNLNLMEAKEMVKEGESPYGVRIEGNNGSEMVLEWRGNPLVRVYALR